MSKSKGSPEKQKLRRLKYNRSQSAKDAARKYATGFTGEMFRRRLAAQGNKCAICHVELSSSGRRSNSPCADHNHATGQQRGILCLSCNHLLGKAKDNKAILARAIDYLAIWELL